MLSGQEKVFFFLAIPNMSVLLHVSASNQIKWNLMYCMVGSCVPQSILSLKVSNYLNQGTVSPTMNPKWPMETLSVVGFVLYQRDVVQQGWSTFQSGALGNLCLDVEISIWGEIWQTRGTDLGTKGRESSEWRQEVGALCSTGRASRSPGSSSGSNASSFVCLVFS